MLQAQAEKLKQTNEICNINHGYKMMDSPSLEDKPADPPASPDTIVEPGNRLLSRLTEFTVHCNIACDWNCLSINFNTMKYHLPS